MLTGEQYDDSLRQTKDSLFREWWWGSRLHKSYVWYPVTQCQFTASTLTVFYTAHSNLPLALRLCVCLSALTNPFRQLLLYLRKREVLGHAVKVLNSASG